MNICKYALLFSCVFFSGISITHAYVINFLPRLSLRGEYSDNIFLTSNSDFKEEEFISIVAPGFFIEIIGKNKSATLDYEPSFAFYNRFPERDMVRHNAAFTAQSALTRNTSIEFENRFIRTEDPVTSIEDPDLTQSDATVRRGRDPYQTNTTRLGLVNEFGRSSYPRYIRLDYTHSILQNDDPTIADNRRYNPSISFAYHFENFKGGLETDFSYTRGEYIGLPEEFLPEDFDQWDAAIRLIKSLSQRFEGFIQYSHFDIRYMNVTENYRIYETSVGLRHLDEDGNFPFSISIGYFIQERDVQGERSAVLVNGDITKRWSYRRGAINLFGESGYRMAHFGAENLGLDLYYLGELTADYYFTRRLTGNINGSYRNDNYVDEEPEREDITTIYGSRLSYQPRAWILMEVDYTYRNLNSSFDDNDYDENRVFISITLLPSHPRRIV